MNHTIRAILLGTLCLSLTATYGQPLNQQVKSVHVIFKTHLDVGYTDLPSKVEHRYITEFIPKAIAVGNRLRAEGSRDRYVWTTGSWLISAYLQQADPEAVKELEEAIRRGDIVWNGVPYTVESESMSKELFATILRLSRRLDKRFGKKTIAARMSDVPGHTRGVISPLHDAGIRLLDVGCNNQSTVPKVPPVCIWKNIDGKEIILTYYGEYGGDMILPDGKTAVSVKFTGDNHGPHTLEQVKEIYAGLRKKYPKAEVIASNFNEIAEVLGTMSAQLPVVTSEIGDTWIYGYASSPVMMAKYRALSRLYADWIKNGKINPESDTAIDYAVRLGMIAEHTWGLAGSILNNYDKTDVDIFNASRHLPQFRRMEESWREKEDNINRAIALLPENLQTEAQAAIVDIGNVIPLKATDGSAPNQSDDTWGIVVDKDELNILRAGAITYQTFSVDDYLNFYNAYVRGTHNRESNAEFGNPGLRKTKARSASITAKVGSRAIGTSKNGVEITGKILTFPEHPAIDKRVLPEQVSLQYIVKSCNVIEMTVSLLNKPANRLPEAYWVSFEPSDITSVFAEKMGCKVDVLDVVSGGNRQMHCIDRYVDVVTTNGTIRITSLDAPVVAIGDRNALNYSAELPDINKGVHFCLFNNLWGTNFTMWWEGSISYKFKITMHDER
jgi:hypothetical protein